MSGPGPLGALPSHAQAGADAKNTLVGEPAGRRKLGLLRRGVSPRAGTAPGPPAATSGQAGAVPPAAWPLSGGWGSTATASALGQPEMPAGPENSVPSTLKQSVQSMIVRHGKSSKVCLA